MLARSAVLSLLVTAALCAPLQAQESYRVADIGLEFDSPGAAWHPVGEEPVKGGGRSFEFRVGDEDERSIGLIVWELESPPALSALRESELRQMEARGEVTPGASAERRLAGHEALGFRYELRAPDGATPLVIDATYARADGLLLRLAVKLPLAEAAAVEPLVDRARGGIRITPPVAAPFVVLEPDPAHVVTVVHEPDDDERVFRYLEALPGAARAAGGLPLLLALGDELGAPARSFLAKYRPGVVRLVGAPHRELPQAIAAIDEWSAGGTVVVSSRALGPAVQAAALAVRLDAPLLIDRGDLAERLAALAPSRVLAIGAPGLEGPEVRHLDGPAAIARAAGGADYVALCNVADGPGADAAAFAAVLAAARGGVVLPLDSPVVRHAVPLHSTAERPPGLPAAERYLTARFGAGDGEVLVGAAQAGVVRVATHESPRYGRLRVDLDGDGTLEPDEEPRIGEAVELAGERFHLTYHYGHAFVGHLSAELLLDELHPDDVRGELAALAGELGGLEHVAVVGTPERVPFHYAEATGYFEAYDIKQELPSDAPYADLDGDGYLELAVGRLPVADLVGGSAAIATTVAYHELHGDWTARATVIQPGFAELEGALPWVLPNAEALLRAIEADLAEAAVESTAFYRDDVDMDAVLGAMAESAWIAYFNHSGPGTWGIHPGASIVTGPRGRAGDRSLPALLGAPIVFGGGCSSAALDVGQPLAATFPGRFFELGAVAYLGNTRVASAHSEQLAQLFFTRLAGGEHTLGQAYRDGRNFLAHLGEGGHLLGPLDRGVEIGLRDFLWGQHRILNLFGDPALVPRLPAAGAAPIEVELVESDAGDGLRLTVVNRGADRRDPLQMMPAPGQGAPREFFARTGPGMTASAVPGRYVRDGLSPVRSHPEAPPGAWVDVALPPGAANVTVERVAGPTWSDRGFAVRPGARGETRLQLYVPLVHATFERGDGEVARRVVFDVRFERSAEGPRRQSEPRVRSAAPWTARHDGPARITSDAAELLARIAEAYPTRSPASFTLSNPQPRLYGETAEFHGRWDDAGRATLAARGLPPHLAARHVELETAARAVAELPFACPLPPLDGMDVALAAPGVLTLTPLAEREGDAVTEVHVNDAGLVVELVERRFGVTEETRFEWRTADTGLHLARCVVRDPVRPHDAITYDLEYEELGDAMRPTRVTMELVGKLPRPYVFEFSYPRGI
jgi:hypothetical protein